MCDCTLENVQLKLKGEKSIIQTRRLTVQPIFLPSTSPIFMQSLKQKVMKVKRNHFYPLSEAHPIFGSASWLTRCRWMNSWPRCVRDLMPPFLGHGITQLSRKSMFLFWLCHWFTGWKLEIIWFLHTLCWNHASRSQHDCQKTQSHSPPALRHSFPILHCCLNKPQGKIEVRQHLLLGYF